MRDRNVGWFTVLGMTPMPGGTWSYNLPGIYQTTDGGNTWTAIDSSWEWNCIKEKNGTLFTSNGGVAPLSGSECMITTAAAPYTNNGKNFLWQHIYLTKDAGSTWADLNWPLSSSSGFGESWGLCYLQSRHTFFAYPEGGLGAGPHHTWLSSDTGKTWVNAGSIAAPYSDNVSGNIEGAASAIYIQSCDVSSSPGMFRSTNDGQSWKCIGGPTLDADTRFCVLPTCNGGTIIAFDINGGVWETTDGGDGTLPEDDTTRFSIAAIPRIPVCSTSESLATITSNLCPDGLVISSATLVGDTIHFALDSLPTLPESLGGGARDSFYVLFDPLKQAGTFSTKLHITGTTVLPDTSYPFDTIITVTATSTPVTPQLTASSNAFDFAPTSRCSTSDTSIVFRNMGCAPDTLTNVSLAAEGITWLADSATNRDSLPIIIQPGDSVALRFHFAPAGTARYSGVATLTVISMGLTETEMISLSGQGLPGMASLASSLASQSYTFATRTDCGAADSLDFSLHNPDCDTLKILSVHLNSTGNLSAINIGGERSNLIGGDTLHYRWVVSPHDTGASQSTIAITYQLPDGSIHDTIFTASASVVAGNSALAVDTALRDLGSIYVCQERDTIIWLKNTGCDTLRILSGQFDPSHGTNGAYGSDATYPIIIAPGDSAKEEILFTPDTTGHPLSISGNFTITSDANSGPPSQTIPLTTSIVYPIHLTLSLLKFDSATDGSIVKFYLVANWNSPPSPAMISALHFDLTHNDDILSYTGFSGNGLNVKNDPLVNSMMTQHFTLAPIPTSDTIGTLIFQVYLTKASTTPLALSNITFDTPSGLSSDCIASLGDSGSAFTYNYSCGDRTLARFMETGSPFMIESIVPNPARASLRVEGNGEGVEAELDDILGRNILVPTLYALPFTLDVKSIPSGVYYLRLSQSGFVQTRRVVIER
jgi:hypothetical protein